MKLFTKEKAINHVVLLSINDILSNPAQPRTVFETEDIMIINAPLDRLFELYEVESGAWDEDEWQFMFE